MKKLFLTFTALSTLVFFSCASKTPAAETQTEAPAPDLNDNVYDEAENALSDIEEPEVTDLPPEEESENIDDEVEFLEPDELDQLPELDDEDVSAAENENAEDSLLDADGENADALNTDYQPGDAENSAQSGAAGSTNANVDGTAGAGASGLNGTAGTADKTAGEAGSNTTPDENELSEGDADETSEEDAENLEENTEDSSAQNIKPSRSVTMKVSEYLDISYPGKGWIFMGATDSSKNITYFGRKLGTENTDFSLQARIPGTKILHFYKNDAVSGDIIDDYIEVIVQTERGSNTTHVTAPAFKMPVKAKRPVKKPAAIESEADYDDSNDDVELIEENKKEVAPKQEYKETYTQKDVVSEKDSEQQKEKSGSNASSPMIKDGDSSAEASRETQRSASDDSADVTTAPSPELFALAKKQFTEKNYSEALKNINEYLSSSSDNRDEALYIQGQILEAKSDIQDISGAINSYTTLTKNYPASKFWDKANKRIIYLQRFYLQGR